MVSCICHLEKIQRLIIGHMVGLKRKKYSKRIWESPIEGFRFFIIGIKLSSDTWCLKRQKKLKVMEVQCEVQVEYCLSKQTGRFSKLAVQLTRDQWNDHVLFIPPKSRKQCFKIHGNIEKIYNQFEDQGKISLKFASPNVLVYIRGADPYVLRYFFSSVVWRFAVFLFRHWREFQRTVILM